MSFSFHDYELRRRPEPGHNLWRDLFAIAVGVAAAYAVGKVALRSARRFDLAGKVAVVTGGSRGIGLAIARELAGRGAKVAICARDAAELRAAEQDLRTRGAAHVFTGVCDVTQADEIAAFLKGTRDALGGSIDVLVNNAGTITVGPIGSMAMADFRDAMDVNFEAPLMFTLDVLPEMRQRRSGRIVNVASFGGKIPSPHMVAYSASKFALVGLSESLRAELTKDGVYVTTVCPGLVRSGSSIHAKFKGDVQKESAWFTTADNAPLVSISPDRLARKIVDALVAGEPEVITPFVARWQAKLHGIAPGLNTEAAAVANLLLPTSESKSSGTGEPSRLDAGTQSRQRHAEQRFNQRVGAG